MHQKSALLGLNGIHVANFDQAVNNEIEGVKIVIMQDKKTPFLGFFVGQFVKLRLFNMTFFAFHC